MNFREKEVSHTMTKKDMSIRNIDAMIVAKLTQDAKKKGLSREEYVRILLTNFVQSEKQNRETDLYQETIMWNIRVLEEVQKGQQQIADQLVRIEGMFNKFIRLGESSDGA